MFQALRGRWAPRVVICMLVTAAIAAPIADVAAFGIHDHLSASGTEPGSVTAMRGDSTPGHHCELGMTPGILLDAEGLPVPTDVASQLDALSPPLASHTPLVPFSPPRR